MDNEIAVSIIFDFIENNLQDPTLSLGKFEFIKRSYQQWAAYEICNRLLDKRNEKVLDIIDDFKFELYIIENIGNKDNDHKKFLCESSIDIANEIELLFV